MLRFLFDSTKNADVFYRVRIAIPDPFFLLDTDAHSYVFLDKREFGLFEEKNTDSSVGAIPLEEALKAAEKIDIAATRLEKFALYILRTYGNGEKSIQVPERFPLSLVDFLRAQGFEIMPTASLYPRRAQKTKEEIETMQQIIHITEKAFVLIRDILEQSTIRNQHIIFEGNPLSSEWLKQQVDLLFLKEDAINEEGIIISSARQTAVPHHPGEGPFIAGTPIVCDIFPRHRKTKYFADITRTFIKGEPSTELQKMYEAVLRAQERGIAAVRPGVEAKKVHEEVCRSLKEDGYESGEKGFVHATGHGVGLEVHEAPSLGERAEEELKPGSIITIEPGLYYPEVGGIRVEDMVVVTETGVENLTNTSKQWKVS